MQLDYPSPQDNIQSVELANRWSTAIHEAGHAVVSHYLQIAIRGVTIEADAGAEGHLWSFGPGKWFQPDSVVDARTRKTIEKRVMVLTAGRAAQSRVADLPDVVISDAKQDFESAMSLVLYMTLGEPEEAAAYIEWLFLRTQNLLHHPVWWAAVEGLAQQLLIEPTMSGRRCQAVIQEAKDEFRTRR